ncbi:MAG TPA: GerAB/ArcD/ProY family transporter [Ureibacillus sp.]|nr:GerAB/ArcD/ProY family transporter [Ureibacillus sp.]
MNKELQVKPYEMINAFLLFFVVVGSQIGVGIHGFQRIIYSEAKQDAWISVILSLLLCQLVVFIMVRTLKKFGNLDIYGIHKEIFGKFIGNFLNLIYVSYCSFGFFVIIKNYIEVVNTWVFSYVSANILIASLLLIVIYAFSGGFRVMIGICFIGFFFLLWIPPMLIYPMYYSEVRHLLPVMEDLKGILKGAYSMSFTVVGFEILNVLYPYIKEEDRKSVNKYAQLGLLFTFFMYLFIMLVTLTFFSGQQLEKTIWATLTLFGIIRLPFVERVEIITICLWMVIILPNLCLFSWSAFRGTQHLIKIKPKTFVWIFSLLIFILNFFVKTRTEINSMNNIFGHIAFVVVFIYPFLLFLFGSIKKKMKRKKVTGDTS